MGARSVQSGALSGTLCEPWRACAPGPKPAACAPSYLPGKSQSASCPGGKTVDSVEPKATFLGEGSLPRGSRITFPAEGWRQREGE